MPGSLALKRCGRAHEPRALNPFHFLACFSVCLSVRLFRFCWFVRAVCSVGDRTGSLQRWARFQIWVFGRSGKDSTTSARHEYAVEVRHGTGPAAGAAVRPAAACGIGRGRVQEGDHITHLNAVRMFEKYGGAQW